MQRVDGEITKMMTRVNEGRTWSKSRFVSNRGEIPELNDLDMEKIFIIMMLL